MGQKIPRFGMISPEHLDNKNKNQNLLIERKMLNGAAMFFQTKIFKKIRGFDDKIFLYYEENDYFKKCNNLRLKLYTVTNCYHYHTTNGGTSSAIFQNSEEAKQRLLENATRAIDGMVDKIQTQVDTCFLNKSNNSLKQEITPSVQLSQPQELKPGYQWVTMEDGLKVQVKLPETLS